MKDSPLLDILNYEEYKRRQVSRTGKKWGSSTFWNWVVHFQDIVTEVNRTYGQPKSICCMGIRNGNEYIGFKETIGFKDTELYGVDIHPMVTDVGENCFCMDFSRLPKNWEKKFDWVYSNSLDHTFDVFETLREWHRVCKKFIILELASRGKLGGVDLHNFELSDIEDVFDPELFEVVRVWDYIRVRNMFAVLLKVL